MKQPLVIGEEIRAVCGFLSVEQKGKLFSAMLEYTETGAVPDFREDALLPMAWGLARTTLDRERARFEERMEIVRYARYCKYEARHGRKPMTRAEWELQRRKEPGEQA